MTSRLLDLIDNRHYGVSGPSTNGPTKPGLKGGDQKKNLRAAVDTQAMDTLINEW
jgi:hypothetical protein